MLTNSANTQLSDQIAAATRRRWRRFPTTYRALEMQTICSWIDKGESGCVVGLPGSGRSTVLGFLHHRPDVHHEYLIIPPESVTIIPIDLNILPGNSIDMLYRVILRAFYHVCDQFDMPLQQAIVAYYQKHETNSDPFSSQSALLELLAIFEAREARLVWIFNHFDGFCQVATIEMMRTLRSLRDNYKGMLCYLIGMVREVVHLPDLELVEPLYEILDINVCWVGPLSKSDSANMMAREMKTVTPPAEEADFQALWELTGGHATLIRTVVNWWVGNGRQQDKSRWLDGLLAQRNVRHRLMRLWDGLTEEEKFTLSELEKVRKQLREATQIGLQIGVDSKLKDVQYIEKLHKSVLQRLQKKGVCRKTDDGFQIFGTLFAAFIAQVKGRGRGRIWQDERTGELFQGQSLLGGLTPLETAVLRLFIELPRVQHSYTDIIVAAWPEDVAREGVSNDPLHQIIRGLRKKIEPNPSKPVYIIARRGSPENGYQFYPEGLPDGAG